jgi:hypothetical protein
MTRFCIASVLQACYTSKTFFGVPWFDGIVGESREPSGIPALSSATPPGFRLDELDCLACHD